LKHRLYFPIEIGGKVGSNSQLYGRGEDYKLVAP
jgi:hypothetical protein